ncbi:CDP-alcohol phosphatidyltransferase family protein [uncultured Tenacibaculum sp.]|uniref:CDP-alcohol phosphatidyltransferase family protein n=1 Tax=uncultured Tenacibaculum sp. TaxID=174713 RepID=UPI00263424D8|nr:CDP-alcohol phosphatidyltransferase family protein [uncultured Tenacibaculum sp.]
MSIVRHIPNLLTLGNLFCGTVATIFAIKGDFFATAFLVILGIGFDFLDGFAARLLKVQGELGKQLDSLADMVTSGVVPGIVMLQLLVNAIDKDAVGYFGVDAYGKSGSNLPYLGIILTLAACYRLAKFNLDERQTDSFIGVPTPAMSLFVISLPLIVEYTDYHLVVELIQNQYFLIGVILFFSFIMNSEIPLFSLKFKNFGLKDNLVKYVFLVLSIVLLVVIKVAAIPTIILLYILISLVQNMMKK